MVRIIDGEIYQDNDPRLQQLLERQRAAASSPPQRPGAGARHGQPGSASGSRQGAAPATAAGGIDFNAPPFRVVPLLPGQQPLLGIPDIEIFALRVSPVVIAGLVALLLTVGWRGLIAGGIIYYIWQANQTADGGQGQMPQQGATGGGQGQGGGNIFQQVQATLQQQFGQLGGGGGGGASGQGAAGAQRQQQQQQQQRPPAPGQRLGGSAGAGAGPASSSGPGSGTSFAGRGRKLGDTS